MENVQNFPSGEKRVFGTAQNGSQVLVEHVRASGDPEETDLVGKTMAEMDKVPPFDPDAVEADNA